MTKGERERESGASFCRVSITQEIRTMRLQFQDRIDTITNLYSTFFYMTDDPNAERTWYKISLALTADRLMITKWLKCHFAVSLHASETCRRWNPLD